MKKTLLFLLIILLLSYIYTSFIFAIDGYPGFIQDAVCFLPTTYFINHFHQLINPLYDAGLDPVKHRFLFYPPLFPYVIAYILRLIPDHVNNIQIALTILDTVNILLLLCAIYIYAKKENVRASVPLYLFLIIWLLGLFSFYGISDGRPEILCRFFITCFIINNLLHKKNYHAIDGLLIALNLITSPISTFYLIIIKAGLLIYRKEFKVKAIILSIAGFTFIILLFVWLYPYHISELISIMRQHSKNVILNRTEINPIRNLVGYYIMNPYNPLSIFTVFITPLGYLGYQLSKKRNNACLAIFFTFVITLSYFSFRNMGLVYNMFVITPVSFFILFFIFTNENIVIKNFNYKPFTVIIMLILCINSLGNLRKTALYFGTQSRKFSAKDFRQEFNRIIKVADKKEKIVMTFSLWPYCLDKYNNVIFRTEQSNPDLTTQYIIVQQVYSGNSQPIEKEGFTIVENKFIQEHPKLWKIPLGNTIPWFQIAVYKRK